MATIAAWVKIDQECAVAGLEEAGEKLDSAEGEVLLDFSALHRIDAGVLKALEEFANKADDKAVRVVLRGVSVDVYKVLKLVKLSSRFSFATSGPIAGKET